MQDKTRGLGSAELWGGLFWLAVGLFVTWQGWQQGLGALHEPGSGFALFWCGVIASGLSLVIIAAAIAEGGPALSSLWAETRWQKVLLVTVLLLVFGFFFEQIGFIPCSLVLLLVLMRFIDPVPWWQAVAVSFGSVLGVWFVLAKFLRIQLPAGILAPWLG
ncbi:MAG: tripartite tricarboxylate transporter TctB family protein [Hyphomicrobiaceae bacterium]|nr:tripartite tricarboxylate transporter TctB family protein [Hyphomicrobiaceae bacterium]